MYPRGDQILELCSALQVEVNQELQPGQLGDFINAWAKLETYLLENARRSTERNVSVREAIAALAKRGQLESEQAAQLDALRRFRNSLVHQPTTVHPGALEEWLATSRELWRQLSKRER